MRPGRILAGALATAGAGAATWRRLLRAPLPRVEGRTAVRGLEAEVTVERDRLGVPRITARSSADLAFAHGFCHGQDRLWQLDMYRRFSSGRVAELAGPDSVKTDVLVRTLGFRRIAEREAASIPSSDRALLDAYAAGVNAAAAAAPAPPLELQLLRLEFEPWTAVDSLALGKILALGFSTNMESELFRAELIRRVGPERAERLEPSYPEGNPVVMDPAAGWSGDGAGLAAQLAEVREALGLGLQPAGSNNWAVTGERSVTGSPLLSGDPHISATIPDVWYTVELHAPGVELQGGSMPGFPGLVIGQSPHVAWSFTNAMADVQDLFVERIDGDRYEFRGEWRPLTTHDERIRVRGRREPERLRIEETHHGPVITGPLGAERDEPLALAWTGLREPFFTGLGIDAADVRSGEELVERFETYSVPVMNMVWADARGSIGYKLVGKLPVRRGAVPDLPKPGWTGEHDWDGYVPYDELPALVDPPGGVIVTANNRVAAPDYEHHITSDPLDGYRAARIEELLGERERHSLEDFERILMDVHSIPGGIVADRLATLEPDGARERDAIERLRRWDRQLDAHTVAGTIYQAFTVHFAHAVAEAAIGDPAYAERWRARSLLGFTAVTASPWRFQARLLELWEEADPELIGGRDWNELALEALRTALDELEEGFGPNPRRWRWGRVHGVRFAHALGEGGNLPSRVLDRLLSRRLPAGGGQETVCQIGYAPHDGDYTGEWAPSYRLLADLADPRRSRWQHMTGQSGHPGSPHYDDLLGDWLAGVTNPVQLPPVAAMTLVPS